MNFRSLSVLYLFMLSQFLWAQKFGWPIDSPLVLTGNYGELRPNHFHAGVDFSTGGKVNKPVKAVMEGYVSRIRVSSTGYGKCVYITHPNSKVTVYAHLNSFSLKIAKVVEAEQFSRKSFEVELLPAPGVIPVKNGEIIGLSGNTGGSSGPHLHFEIRDEKSETPLNPFEFYKSFDRVAPFLQAVAFYDLSDTLNPVIAKQLHLNGSGTPTVSLQTGIVGFAFAAYDKATVSGSRNNVYNARLYLDGKIIYAHTLRTIDFADSRYVNEFSEKAGRFKYQKCFVPTLFPDRLYDTYINKGRIKPGDTLPHKLLLELRDEAGNLTAHEFIFRTKMTPHYKTVPLNDPMLVRPEKDFTAEVQELKLYIPGGTLYKAAVLQVKYDPIQAAISVDPSLNMKSAFVLALPVPAQFKMSSQKTVLKTSTGVLPPVVRNDSLYFFPKVTGSYRLLADNEAPQIRPLLSASRQSKIRHFSSYSFHISDRLSGIGNYSMLVNGKWVIAEYDAKNNSLTYFFDANTPAGPLHFEVEVEDRVGNKRKFSYRLNR